MKQLIRVVFLLIIISFVISTGCRQQTNDNTTAAFDMQSAKSFIDSINTVFTGEVRYGDSVALASHYLPDAELLLSNSEAIKGKDIISAWGGMINMGIRDFSLSTTDITGDTNFLIETGIYEMRDGNKTLIDKGNYVVVWKKQNGDWKLYRDIGATSLPATK